jgi:hypothetical protein
MKRTVKIQVIEAVSKEIMKLQCEGHKYLRFKDLQFCTDDYCLSGHSPYYGNGWDSYEVQLAWKYLRENYPYGKYYVSGHNGNAKFFEITNK